MNSVETNPIVLADLLDIVDTAVATVVRRLPVHVARDDLASVGKLALVAALAQVNGPEDEVRAYCFVRVRGAMLDELRRLDTRGRTERAGLRAIARAQRSVASTERREATIDELAQATGLPVKRIGALLALEAADRARADCALDELPDQDAPTPVQSVELVDLRESLVSALNRLPDNHACALRMYYLEDATLDDIAAKLGVSRERARQVREAAEKRLRSDFVVLSLWQAVLNAR